MAFQTHSNRFNFTRYYHYGFDKQDNVDEIGQPIPEDLFENRCAEDDASTLVEDTCEAPDFLHPEMFDTRCCSLDDEAEKQQQQPTMVDEGMQTVVVETLPQVDIIVVATPPPPTLPEVIETRATRVSSPSLHLNIFDQSSMLKLITARNWTETFFNRVFRKNMLSSELEEQLLHLTQQDYCQLPAIVSRNGMMRFVKLIMKAWILSLARSWIQNCKLSSRSVECLVI